MISTNLEAACRTCAKPIIGRRSTLQTKCVPCVIAEANARDKENAKAQRQAAIDARKQHAADKRETKRKLESMKSLRELRREAQTAFNTAIRYRDRLAGHPCISCRKLLDWNSTKPGGAVDAGHFIGRGADISLAFDERNVNAQCKGCNRPNGTTKAQFTAGMVERWGAAVVAELEGPQPVLHLKHDELRRIRDTSRATAQRLKKQLETA